MPGILHHPIGRRSFLKSTITMAAGSALFSRVSMEAAVGLESTLHLALLSDTHIPADPANTYRGFQPVANLDRILPEVMEAKPEGVIINGDAARLTGELDDYRQLRKQLEPLAESAPVYIGLGNHDHRSHFYEVIEGMPGAHPSVSGKHVVAIEHPAARVLILDSLLYVNKVAGLLGRVQREWLTGYLENNDDRPVVLLVHHTLGEDDGDLLDTDRLFRLIAAHPQVKAIFYGHSHRHEYAVRDGIHLINLPAVGYNFSDDQPVGWMDAVFHPGGVSLVLRAFGGNMTDNGKRVDLDWSGPV